MMLPQSTITVVDKKDGISSSSSSASSGLDLLFAAAAQHQQPKMRRHSHVVTDCESTISSLSVDIPTAPAPAPPTAKIFFPEVLMDMLNNNPRFEPIISWKPDGKSFIIKNRYEFKEKVLPLYFQSNFDSFLRKLKRWGFEKVKAHRRGQPSIEFKHQYFHRDESGLCLRMRCKSGPSTIVNSCDIQASPQEVMASFSVNKDTSTVHQKSTLIDHLTNQQFNREDLLQEINKAALVEQLVAITEAADRRYCTTHDQALNDDQLLVNDTHLLMTKQLVDAAKKAQLANNLSDYMSAPHCRPKKRVYQQDLNQIAQWQRLGQVLDNNARTEDFIARYYRPMSASRKTQQSRAVLRASILKKRQEIGLSQLPNNDMNISSTPQSQCGNEAFPSNYANLHQIVMRNNRRSEHSFFLPN